MQSGKRGRCSAATMSSALRRVGAQQKHSISGCQLPRYNNSVSEHTTLPPVQRHCIDPHHCTTFALLSLFLPLNGT
jgi:hypothetical protein